MHITCIVIVQSPSFVDSNLTQAEGFITGLGAKLFTVAGPVLVFGITASVVFGLVLWIIQLI
jgi:hypothetical protein